MGNYTIISRVRTFNLSSTMFSLLGVLIKLAEVKTLVVDLLDSMTTPVQAKHLLLPTRVMIHMIY
jgi:hypothetical protein